ncbi:TPA: subtilase cytotoxin subunit B-like protein [Yersinia enterocolitica]|nr:subtilase cytotoxin subunit B-like protein [Yersinia enterocolitica]
MKIKAIALTSLLVSSVTSAAMKDYDTYYSNVIINNFSSGVYNSGGKDTTFFCIGYTRVGNKPDINNACKVDVYGKYKNGFSAMMDTAKFYYSTGLQVRVYIKKDVWYDPAFRTGFSANELIAITSCSSHDYCVGPKLK